MLIRNYILLLGKYMKINIKEGWEYARLGYVTHLSFRIRSNNKSWFWMHTGIYPRVCLNGFIALWNKYDHGSITLKAYVQQIRTTKL